MKKNKINIQGTEITLFSQNDNDFISITDIAKYTVEFVGFWKQMHNPNFNVTNSVTLKIKQALMAFYTS